MSGAATSATVALRKAQLVTQRPGAARTACIAVSPPRTAVRSHLS